MSARAGGRRYGSGVHRVHRGDRSIPLPAALVGALLPDAAGARRGLRVRHADRSAHLLRGHDRVASAAQGQVVYGQVVRGRCAHDLKCCRQDYELTSRLSELVMFLLIRTTAPKYEFFHSSF